MGKDGNMKIKKAIIPAAGLGTRFCLQRGQPGSAVVDKPTIQFIVEEAVQSGIRILIITGRNKRAIEDHFDKSVELELVLKNKGQKTFCLT